MHRKGGEKGEKITNRVIGTSRRITTKISKTLRKKNERKRKEELERKNRKIPYLPLKPYFLSKTKDPHWT